MKNGHDKVDDVFCERLGGLESGLPEGFFEETWAKSEPGKTTLSPTKGINPFYYIIPAVVVIVSSIYFFQPGNTSETGISGKHSFQNYADNNINLYENLTTVETGTSSAVPATNNNNQIAENVSMNTTYPSQVTNEKKSPNNNNNNNNVPATSKHSPVIDNSDSDNAILSYNNNNTEPESKIITGLNKTETSVAHSAVNTVMTNTVVYTGEKMSQKNFYSIPQSGMNTAFIEYTGRDISHYDPYRWSADLSVSAHYFNSSIKSLNPETSLLADTRNNALEPGITSYNLSLMLNLHKNSFIASAGVNYNMFSELTDYGIALFNPQTHYEQYYNGTPYTFTLNGNYYQVDSTSYWHYTFVADSVIHVSDSVQTFEIDTILVSVFDSLAITKFDTADYSKLKANYSLIEFPLYAGIEINKGKWGYTFSAGIIPGFLMLRGSLFNGTEQVLLPSDIFPLRKFVLSGGLKVQFNYYPGTRIMLFAGPEIKGLLLNASEKGSGFQQKWYSWGLRGGIRYFF